MCHFVGCVGCVCRRSASGGALVASRATVASGESVGDSRGGGVECGGSGVGGGGGEDGARGGEQAVCGGGVAEYRWVCVFVFLCFCVLGVIG